jgi:Xaa-Pro dipeptidase
MRGCDIEAVVAASPTNVRYLTGYWCWLAPQFREFMVQPGGTGALALRNFALVSRERKACLVVDPHWALAASDASVTEVRVAGPTPFTPTQNHPSFSADREALYAQLAGGNWLPDPIAELAAAITDSGLSRSRIGIEAEGLHPAERAALNAALPQAHLLDCTNMIRIVRAVKTRGEIEWLARAAEIGESAAAEVVAHVVPGITPTTLSDLFRARVAQDGADLDHFAVCLDGLGFLTHGDQPLQSDSWMYIDFGCVYRGWYSDAGTTLCVGRPPRIAATQHALAREAIAAGAAAIRPGIRGSAIQHEMQLILADGGMHDSLPQGHGIGLEVRDYPILLPHTGRAIRDDCIQVNADLALEDGMVISLEAGHLRLGRGSVQCEQTFVVTETGSRALTAQDRSMPLFAN